MAGAACKVIIDNLRTAVSDSLEAVLIDERVREAIGEEKADALLQELVDNDLRSYVGTTGMPTNAPPRGLGELVQELESLGIFTQEVWGYLRHPGHPWVPSGVTGRTIASATGPFKLGDGVTEITLDPTAEDEDA